MLAVVVGRQHDAVGAVGNRIGVAADRPVDVERAVGGEDVVNVGLAAGDLDAGGADIGRERQGAVARAGGGVPGLEGEAGGFVVGAAGDVFDLGGVGQEQRRAEGAEAGPTAARDEIIPGAAAAGRDHLDAVDRARVGVGIADGAAGQDGRHQLGRRGRRNVGDAQAVGGAVDGRGVVDAVEGDAEGLVGGDGAVRGGDREVVGGGGGEGVDRRGVGHIAVGAAGLGHGQGAVTLGQGDGGAVVGAAGNAVADHRALVDVAGAQRAGAGGEAVGGGGVGDGQGDGGAEHRGVVGAGDGDRHRARGVLAGAVADDVAEAVGGGLAGGEIIEHRARIVGHRAVGVDRDHALGRRGVAVEMHDVEQRQGLALGVAVVGQHLDGDGGVLGGGGAVGGGHRRRRGRGVALIVGDVGLGGGEGGGEAAAGVFGQGVIDAVGQIAGGGGAAVGGGRRLVLGDGREIAAGVAQRRLGRGVDVGGAAGVGDGADQTADDLDHLVAGGIGEHGRLGGALADRGLGVGHHGGDQIGRRTAGERQGGARGHLIGDGADGGAHGGVGGGGAAAGQGRGDARDDHQQIGRHLGQLRALVGRRRRVVAEQVDRGRGADGGGHRLGGVGLREPGLVHHGGDQIVDAGEVGFAERRRQRDLEHLPGLGVDAPGVVAVDRAQSSRRQLVGADAETAVGVGEDAVFAGIPGAVVVGVDEHPRALDRAVDDHAAENGRAGGDDEGRWRRAGRRRGLAQGGRRRRRRHLGQIGGGRRRWRRRVGVAPGVEHLGDGQRRAAAGHRRRRR